MFKKGEMLAFWKATFAFHFPLSIGVIFDLGAHSTSQAHNGITLLHFDNELIK